jgi:dihydrofolate reductase
MEKVLFGMTMSVDGFLSDRNGGIGRLYPDLDELRKSEMLQEEIATTGAVVMGRHAYDMAGGNLTGYEFQVPIFVLTHRVPETAVKGENGKLVVKFVIDGIESAIKLAKSAAGDQYVTVIGGANTGQQLINAGLIDEIQIGIVPVLLGAGLRLFEQTGLREIDLEMIRVFESSGRIDIRYRVVK